MSPAPATRSRASRILLFFLSLGILGAVFYYFSTISIIAMPVLFGLIMTYLLEPVVTFFEHRRLPRGVGILASFALASLPITFFALFLPGWLADEYKQLIEVRSPQAIEHIEGLLEKIQAHLVQHYPYFAAGGALDLENFNIGNFVVENSLNVLPKLVKTAPALVATVLANYVVILLLTPIVTYYLLRDARRMKATLVRLVPNAYFEMALSVIPKIDQQVGGYIRGRIIEAAITGALAYVILAGKGIQHAGFMSLIVGLTNLIPYVGPWIGTVLAAMIGMIEYETFSPILWILAACLIAQILDNVFIGPFVISKSVDLHPFAIVVICIAGAKLMGLLGLIVAVPLVCIVKVVALEFFTGLRRYHVA
ncbi:MAG: AI-2E family transporter [Vicinamibacteria bacterium]